MKRYTGAGVAEGARIAVITNDALGNFVVATPLLQMLRSELKPLIIDYFGGNRIAELAKGSDLIDYFWPLHGQSPRSLADERFEPYDLVVNVEWTTWAKCAAAILAGENGYVCGPCLDEEGRADLPFADDERGDLWRDQEWVSAEVTSRYPFLGSGFIGEVFCRLAYLGGEVPAYRVQQHNPGGTVPDVLLATSASLQDKLWPVENWTAIVSHMIGAGATVGLLGASPKSQKKYWLGADEEQAVVSAGAADLRGAFTLPEVVGALARCKLALTLDNGILHLACAAGTPTIGLYRHGIRRLWAPPHSGLRVVEAPAGDTVASIPLVDVQADVERSW